MNREIVTARSGRDNETPCNLAYLDHPEVEEVMELVRQVIQKRPCPKHWTIQFLQYSIENNSCFRISDGTMNHAEKKRGKWKK